MKATLKGRRLRLLDGHGNRAQAGRLKCIKSRKVQVTQKVLYAGVARLRREQPPSDGAAPQAGRPPRRGHARRAAAQRVDGRGRPGPHRLLGPPAALPDAAVGGRRLVQRRLRRGAVQRGAAAVPGDDPAGAGGRDWPCRRPRRSMRSCSPCPTRWCGRPWPGPTARTWTAVRTARAISTRSSRHWPGLLNGQVRDPSPAYVVPFLLSRSLTVSRYTSSNSWSSSSDHGPGKTLSPVAVSNASGRLRQVSASVESSEAIL